MSALRRFWLMLFCRHTRGFHAQLQTIEPTRDRQGVVHVWCCHDCGRVINRGYLSWKVDP